MSDIKDYLDPSRYGVIDLVTGEVMPVTILMDKTPQRWNMAFAKTLADYLNLSGNPATAVLAHLLTVKDSGNRILATIRDISVATDVSTKTVNRLMTKLKAVGFIRQIKNGQYMLSPHIMRHGEKTRGAMVLRMWNAVDIEEAEVK